MPTFEIMLSESFAIEMFGRYYQSQWFARFVIPLRVFGGVLFASLAVIGIVVGTYISAVFLALFVPLAIFSKRIENRILVWRIRKSPYMFERVRIELSPEGFTAVQAKGNAHMNWSAFTAARQFDDGFLLLQGPSQFNWLPVSAMTQGSAGEVEELLRKNIADYEYA